MRKLLVSFTIIVFVFSSCVKSSDGIAVVWTDRVDFALYAEIFNAQSSEYKVVVKYKDNPADALINNEEKPDLVIGPWLKGQAARKNFDSLDFLLKKNMIDAAAFYPDLLQLGSIEGKQLLLPVSFNLPTVIFNTTFESAIENPFLITPDDMRTHSSEYNKKSKGVYTRMGFSPRWDDDFLYAIAKGFHASFEEANNFFSWDNTSLDSAVRYIRAWTQEVNTSHTLEDEFKFNYLYDPPYTLVTGGRCLFWYLAGDDLFSLPIDKLKNIGFRWLSFNGKIPLQDDIIYAALCKDAQDAKAAAAFLQWFYTVDTQTALLERSRSMNVISKQFGLAGGFSSLMAVSEQIFPRYYPLLLAHLPRRNSFSVPHILPSNWPLLKEQILLPYLQEASIITDKNDINDIPSINKKIAEWYKVQ